MSPEDTQPEEEGFDFVTENGADAPEETEPEEWKAPEVIVQFLSSSIVTPHNANRIDNHAVMTHGKLRMVTVNCVADKDAGPGSEFVLCRLDPGRVRVMNSLSLLQCRFASEDMFVDIGVPAYLEQMRGRQDARPDFFASAQTPWKGPRPMLFNEAFNPEFTTREGLFIVATLDGEVKKGDSITGNIVYVRD